MSERKHKDTIHIEKKAEKLSKSSKSEQEPAAYAEKPRKSSKSDQVPPVYGISDSDAMFKKELEVNMSGLAIFVEGKQKNLEQEKNEVQFHALLYNKQ